MKKIEQIDILNTPIDIENHRDATNDEILLAIKKGDNSLPIAGVKEKIGEINTYSDLVKQSMIGTISSNEIDNKLEENKNYKKARLSKTPKKLLDYQKTNDKSLQKDVNKEVVNNGVILSQDQVLFHGGNLQNETSNIITTETLSTTLNPHVGISNALHRGKAFDDGELHLNILTTKDESVKAFIFNNKTKMSHEREVLLENDLKITKTKETFIKKLEASDGKGNTKKIAMKIIEHEISKEDNS